MIGWIDAARSAGRNAASIPTTSNERTERASDSTTPEPKAGEGLAQKSVGDEREDDSNGESAKNPCQRAPENQEDDVGALGSHRHAQAYFDSALVGDVADESVDADDGEQQARDRRRRPAYRR